MHSLKRGTLENRFFPRRHTGQLHPDKAGDLERRLTGAYGQLIELPSYHQALTTMNRH